MLAFVVLTGVSPRVGADPAEARKHFELGKRYVQVDEYRKAIEEFKAGHILTPDPAFLYNIAECYRRLSEHEEALKFYRRFLAISPAGNPQREMATTRVAELEKAGATATPAVAAPNVTAERAPAVVPPPVPAPAPRPVPTDVPPPSTEPTSAPQLTAAPDTTVAAEPSDSSRPFYRRAWFYGVVGAVVVGGALGAWAISSRGGTDIPSSDLGHQPAFQPK